MAVILEEPEFIRQEKLFSCWFACLKMLLLWHEGDRSIGDKAVSDLASWTTPHSFQDLPTGFLKTRNIERVGREIGRVDAIEAELLNRGPFCSIGDFGRNLVGKRTVSHAILVYGVLGPLPDPLILHHDPMSGAGCKMKSSTFLSKEGPERLHYKRDLARVQIRA